MKKKNVEEKLADLLQAFRERKELSVNDISQLLSCNRQSVYNYVNRLSERGIELECKKHRRTVYYHLVSDDTGAAWASCIPLTDKILRKYNIVQNLQTASATQRHWRSVIIFVLPSIRRRTIPTMISSSLWISATLHFAA